MVFFCFFSLCFMVFQGGIAIEPPGRYKLRLVLSDDRCTKVCCGLGLSTPVGGVFGFSSAEFVIAAPPKNGICRM